MYAKKKMKHELLGYDKKSGRKIVSQTWWNQNSQLRDFIEDCLQYDYMDRPSAAELLNYPFLDLSQTSTSTTV